MRKKLLVFLLFSTSLYSMKIDRVILSSDDNPNYIQFWPLVAKAWSEIIGVRPTLFLVADKSVQVDESIGDVIRFEPIAGIKTSYQAQVIRILAPAFFENEVSILSDIDTLPINKKYFIQSVAKVPNNHHVVYRNNYDKDGVRYPLCYHAVRGSSCLEMFKLKSIDLDVVREKLIEWERLGYDFNTDELVLTEKVKRWGKKTGRVTLLNLGRAKHIDKLRWHYSLKNLKTTYVGAHMPRPFNENKEKIMQLVNDLGISYSDSEEDGICLER